MSGSVRWAQGRRAAVGLNFIDTYQRSGLYPLPLPSGIGLEAAGIVEEVGEGVSHVKVGDRVAYAGGPAGAYAQERVMPASPLVRLPKEISDYDPLFSVIASGVVKAEVRQLYALKDAAQAHHDLEGRKTTGSTVLTP
jgi:NADPH2:quinone reductase